MKIGLETFFDESAQETSWQNRVAKDLNVLLGYAKYFKETSNDESDERALRATLRIIKRVAEFEEIKIFII